jgi:hypothetical protein
MALIASAIAVFEMLRVWFTGELLCSGGIANGYKKMPGEFNPAQPEHSGFSGCLNVWIIRV